MNPDYAEFLAAKAPRAHASGFEPSSLPNHLADFQQACVAFNLRQGRAGLYLDTGLGKTRCQLEWAKQCAEQSNGMALILTPLAVARQIEREALQLGYEARVIRDQSQAKAGINICNYDRLDKIESDAFGAVSLDEAGILKSFGGKIAGSLIDAFAGHRFRLCATATPAPNDHMELGQQSAFLGIMPANEMLMRWFINDTAEASQQWRLKKHAEQDFYNWLASWSVMAGQPSDITGCAVDDAQYKLPPIKIIRHRADRSDLGVSDGGLFGIIEASATTLFDIKRQTQGERIKTALSVILEGEKWSKREKILSMRGAVSATQQTLNSRKSGEKRITNGNEGNTQPIQNIGKNKPNTLPNGTVENPDGRNTTIASSGIISAPENLTPSLHPKAAVAPSAELPTASTSIIVTIPGESEAFSAKIAIGDLETSEIASTTFDAPNYILSDWWLIWVDTNEEQDALAARLGNSCLSIKGSQTTELKEELHEAWLRGDRKILITKPSMFGFGCNWQHCHNVIYLGRTFSYESWYQSVRRCWRFGQTQPVNVHIIVAEGEDQIGRVIDRKAADHSRMKEAMAKAMRRNVGRGEAKKVSYNPQHRGDFPAWL